jgi:hypothetical protein
MSDRWTDRLSAYLDGELEPAEARACEAHLGACAGCAATLQELRQVAERAGALGSEAPGAEVWAGIAERIRSTPQESAPGTRTVQPTPILKPEFRRGVSLSVPQLIAAGIAVAVLSGGVAWVALWKTEQATPVRVTAGAQAQVPGLDREADEYDAAIASLEQSLAAGRGQLDTSTVRILEQNLRTIRSATEQARRALAADPANPYLRSYMDQTMRRRLDLLRKATNVVASLQ